MRGPKSPRTVNLTPQEREALLSLTRSTAAPAGRARRARIVLLAADGMPLKRIAHIVGVQRNVVRKWLDRYPEKGLKGLEDKPRPGRPRVFSPRGRHGADSHRLSDARPPGALAEPVGLRRAG